MGKDLVKNPYGRFYHLAYYLAEIGHNVHFILISYRKNENHSVNGENLYIKSISLLPNPIHTLFTAYQEVRNFNADWIFGFSDTYFGIMAVYFARYLKTRSLVDAYDNYESYLSFLKPLHWLWRSAVRKANLVTCTGPGLVELFRQYRRTGAIEILPMTVDPSGFLPNPGQDSRKFLDLPVDKKLVGYHGSIHHSRDITVLFDAISELRAQDKDILLVLSGRRFANVKIPGDALYLGYLPDAKVPHFVNSMDVIAVPNRRSGFGEHSYPIKIYEAMACNIPVVATQTRATEWILKEHKDCLVPAGDAGAFAAAIGRAVTLGRVEYKQLPTWSELAGQLNSYLI